VIGLLSIAAGLATGHLVGALISPSASPLLAVGATAIDLTPTWLKDFAVRTFGTYDKVVLLSGMAVVIALIGVVGGLISRRSRTPGLVLIGVLGLIAVVAVLSRPTAGTYDGLAPLVALITSAGTFVGLRRVDVNLTLPQLRAEDWRLRIHGMVNREITLTFSDLMSRALIERPLTMTCVSNEVGGPYISTANFTGVLLADILAEAGVQRAAEQAFSTSVDGWTCGTPTAALTDAGRNAMLVIAMNGEPLPVEHGFPVRLVVPGLYGFVSGTKWITDLELTTFAARQAYWLQRGWGQRAPIKTMSRIDSPGPFERVSPDTTITGVAWAQTRGIERVEVRLDHGRWQPAELSTEVSVDTWRMFRLRGRWTPGAHVAEVRATDKTGYTQTPDRAAPIPDGATGWHSVEFTVQ
jgi:DMSO/TMAO reductase YedYZ molybdopterin-dependent catalytic subunit